MNLLDRNLRVDRWTAECLLAFVRDFADAHLDIGNRTNQRGVHRA